MSCLGAADTPETVSMIERKDTEDDRTMVDCFTGGRELPGREEGGQDARARQNRASQGGG